MSEKRKDIMKNALLEMADMINWEVALDHK